MRIWDIHPSRLCRKHLLGEHRELHGLWNILTQGKKGYSKHPETLRWVGKAAALARRHDDLVDEMLKRGYNHHSPLVTPPGFDLGSPVQDLRLESVQAQASILNQKPCSCKF